MLKRFLPSDLIPTLRENAIGLAVFVLCAALFLVLAGMGLRLAENNFSWMVRSPWVLSVENVDQAYKPGDRYDLSKDGVVIPPAREDRLLQSEGENSLERANQHGRDCYEVGYTIEESDLCAQWSNAAAVRFGNMIAAETYRLNALVGFLTAFGVFLGSVGVVFAGTASLSAGRAVRMMAYGFMPGLSFSASVKNAGWTTITVRNVGTGPASNIRVKVDGRRARLVQNRLGPGAHTTFLHKVSGDTIEIEGSCLDLAKERQPASANLVRRGGDWILDEEQPSQSD
ncbi:hypothetical protein [Pacificimonas flava]|uniref:hypothetical protein n=1 Tax=Pacificimonas flava TaxID=1234595 RepID=UPI001A9C7F27|nr:hypothetical protein [Pacificimonas flava]